MIIPLLKVLHVLLTPEKLKLTISFLSMIYKPRMRNVFCFQSLSCKRCSWLFKFIAIRGDISKQTAQAERKQNLQIVEIKLLLFINMHQDHFESF